MPGCFITTSWDDGAREDIKLSRLLKKYNIPATFYIPISNFERPVLSRKEIYELSKDFEIGAHGLTHRSLTNFNENDLFNEIKESKVKLESIIGKKVNSFCYPQGKVNSDIKQVVGEAGFSFARTTSLFATNIGDKLLVPTTVHTYPHDPLVYLKEGIKRKLYHALTISGKEVLDWTDIAYFSLDYCLTKGGLFHLWGHSWEIEQNNDWHKLEKVLDYISKRTTASARGTNTQIFNLITNKKAVYYNNLKPDIFQSTFATNYYYQEEKFISKYILDFDKKNNKILDIGCGTARFAKMFKNANYSGVDFAQKFINYNIQKNKDKNKKFIKAEYSELQKLNLGKMDLILIWGLFEDSTNPFFELKKLNKFIKSKTRIIFTLHNADNPLLNSAQFIKTEFFENNFPYTSFTPKVLKKQLVDFSKINGWKYSLVTFGLIPPMSKIIPGTIGGLFGATIIVVLDKK